MKRTPLEFLGKTAEQTRRFSRFKKIEVIFFNNLTEKKILKKGYLTMPYKAGHYDYTTDIINLFLETLKIKVKFVSRETLRKSKTFVYHIYIF
jgi:hypothetical protein